jgi:hypothetical protein
VFLPSVRDRFFFFFSFTNTQHTHPSIDVFDVLELLELCGFRNDRYEPTTVYVIFVLAGFYRVFSAYATIVLNFFLYIAVATDG